MSQSPTVQVAFIDEATGACFGTADLPPTPRNAMRTAAAIPGSQIKAYEGAPHGLFITEHARFNRDLLEFAQS